MNRWIPSALSFALLLLSPAPAPAGLDRSNLSREAGAVYIEDYFEKPIEIEVLKPAPIFYQLDGKRRLGTLVGKQKVTIVAVSEKAYRVRGMATHGRVSGWVGTAFLKEPSKDFYANMKKLYERQQLVDELIANREIALGMTAEEVIEALGKPDERKSKIDAAKTTETLAYVTYDRVPQVVPRRNIYGQYVNSTVYVKVEVGRMSVNLQDGVVSSIEEKERDPRAGRIKVVPSPIFFY